MSVLTELYHKRRILFARGHKRAAGPCIWCILYIILSKNKNDLSLQIQLHTRVLNVLTPNDSIEQPAIYNAPACEFLLLKICKCTAVF